VSALGAGLENALKTWAQSAKIPALPIYPAFAAFPASITPPMPNVPFPVIAMGGSLSGFSSMEASMTVRDPAAQAVLRAIAGSVAAYFPQWQLTTLVTNMLGHGPVPTFAPPYVPVGPVVGGSVIPTPGIFTGGI
jgi:hypothetical protein